MSRLELSLQFFSREGIKFLLLELIIVFVGVYGAFLFQNYSEQRKIDAEKDKVMVGVKEDLEYFRIFFPDYAGDSQVEEWKALVAEERYTDYSGWRFIQPQYDYIAVEYALASDAEVIDFELNSAIAEIYQELKKLEHAENLLTELAMKYQAVPEGDRENVLIRQTHLNNFLNFERFTERYADRAGIMNRIAEMSNKHLPLINGHFSPEELRDIEINLIRRNVSPEHEEEREFLLGPLQKFFPNLSEEDLRTALSK